MALNNILVVCVGNICRSPMAKAILQARYPNKKIDSAGISAVIDHPADPNAIKLMADNSIDITDHIAKQINEDMVLNSDLILTMTDNQTKWIVSNWPYCRGKTFRLGVWRDNDIADPYRCGESAFEKAYQDITESLADWQDRLN